MARSILPNSQFSTLNAQLSIHLLDTGYCLASEHHVMRGGRRRALECHALVGLLHHPQQGWLLWDTGYAPRMLEATRPWPFWLYRYATPLRLGQPVVHQLGRFGLQPADIQAVILSHFHADHVAGLRDFPHARIITSAAGYADVSPRRGLAALRRAFIPALLPEDFARRVELIAHFDGPPLPHLGPTHDLFGDGTLRLVNLPGHARGQLGLLVATPGSPTLLAADGAWHSQAIRERRPPHPIANLIVDDARAVRDTLYRLHDFAHARPEVRIVPTHCPEVFARLGA
jgi:glyoxylase-like metal-dependent hydrolase (beta-lactamase superfamily II)